ncbi:hypothetical protein JMJ58_19315 [Haloterrigena salifodinae]|uniref:Uncharacterized protein n=1 Tax=Haloterrigena salifodinae TaxID=2675099 RepID=A0A8T8E0C2_9EURY|nr:hypothetical protein [Haloterrigena salifodinae]QRV15032.1 hypothetical protein JMJ58_19315 [Haloterrigena salifodinae]
MVHARIATGAEQPINRDGGLAQAVVEEADLVGLDENGDVVTADADSASPVSAVGIAAAPTDDLSNYDSAPDTVRSVVESERSLVGRDRIAFINHGVIVENADEDWDFTPGEPVFLAVGGGYTQAEPADASGELRQVVGVAIEDGNALFLNINYDYTVA